MIQDRPQELQQFLAQALAQVGDAVVVIDHEECVTYLNATAAAQYEITEAQALGQPLRSLYTHFWLQPDAEKAAYASLAARGFWRGENLHVLHNGRKLYVDSTVTALKNAEGAQVGLLAVIRDITAQKEAEKQVRRSEERLRRMMEIAQVGIAFVRQDGQIAECNDALLHLFGYTRAEYAADGLNWQALQLPGDETHIAQSMKRLYEVGVLPPLERTCRRKDGSSLPVMLSAATIQADTPTDGATNNERQIEHVVFVVDLSELKQTQAALQELNNTLEQRVAERTAELERSNRELDRFAYIASHDLKSPLRAIDNLATWIAEDTADMLPPAAQIHLTKLRTRVKRLETLLNDLLHYSRAGRRRYTVEPVDTRALTHSVAAALKPPSDFSVQIADNLPTIRSERLPLETVLRSLLENALKHHHHTQEGKVEVTAERRNGWVEFCVRDNGPGIAAQFHERIFEVFQTLRPRDEVEGSGMGLAIVKKTVESAGGKVWVESAEGEGAAFRFTWPAGT